jgi:two-component system, response regulator
MDNKMILPVENYPDEKVLRLQALKKNNIADDVAVVRDGAEALQLLFCTEAYADH